MNFYSIAPEANVMCFNIADFDDHSSVYEDTRTISHNYRSVVD